MQEFLRFKALDNVELCGALYKANSKKYVIHIHGLCSSYYENNFVDYLAKMYNNLDYNFLTFNNRGHGLVSELVRLDEKPKYVIGGTANEVFEECIYDLESAVDYVTSLGAEEIILEAHSFGCNKAVYYYLNKPNDMISRIILLSPCDAIGSIKAFNGESYESSLNYAKKLIDSGKENTLLESPLYPITFSAKTFLRDWIPNSRADIFRYLTPNYTDESLKNIKIPIFIEIGTKDKMALAGGIDSVNNFYKNNFGDYQIKYIENAGHNFFGFEKELANNIEQLLKEDN